MNGAHLHREHRASGGSAHATRASTAASDAARQEADERTAREAKRREERPDLHDALVAAGCTIDNHASDLYVLSTDTARKVITEAGYSLRECQPFVSQVDGRVWLDFPFRFSPYWRERSGRPTVTVGTVPEGKRYGVTVVHGEGRSMFHVVDGYATEDNQPAVVHSESNREAAQDMADHLNAGRRKVCDDCGTVHDADELCDGALDYEKSFERFADEDDDEPPTPPEQTAAERAEAHGGND